MSAAAAGEKHLLANLKIMLVAKVGEVGDGKRLPARRFVPWLVMIRRLGDTAVQQQPEEYRDLMVRISGYSAFFTPLNKELQTDVIERMKFDVD